MLWNSALDLILMTDGPKIPDETPDHPKPPIIVTVIALAARRTIFIRYY